MILKIRIKQLKPILFIFLIPFMVQCNSAVDQTDTLGVEAPMEERAPLLMSIDFGETWTPIAKGLPSDTQVSFLALSGSEMVLASDNKGIFISQDNLSKWTSIGKDLPNSKINALYVSDQKIYVGIYQAGIYVTMDEGKSWQSLNHNLSNLNVQSILRYNQQLLVGTDFGLFMLANHANTWQATNLSTQVLSIYEYNDKLVAGTSQGTALSQDGGLSWEWIRQKGAVHYTQYINQRIVELALNGDVIYSDDWGENWNETQYQPRTGSYVYEIIQVGDYQIMSNNYGIHRSRDQGKSWAHIFETESMAFFDLIAIGNTIYGGTRAWDEYRKRK